MSLRFYGDGFVIKSIMGSLGLNDALTFSCWIKTDTISASSARTLMTLKAAGLSTIPDRYTHRLYITTTNEIAALTGSDTASSASTTTAKIRAGVWHHVAAVFSGTSFRQAWLDGIPATSNTTSRSAGPAAVTLTIGASYMGLETAAYYDGIIAAPAVYYNPKTTSTSRLTSGYIQRLTKLAPQYVRQNDLYYCPDFSPVGSLAEPEAVNAHIKTYSMRSAHAQFAESPLLDTTTMLNVAVLNDEPPTLKPRNSLQLALPSFPSITNKLRAQAAMLRPYAGILPIADG